MFDPKEAYRKKLLQKMNASIARTAKQKGMSFADYKNFVKQEWGVQSLTELKNERLAKEIDNFTFNLNQNA